MDKESLFFPFDAQIGDDGIADRIWKAEDFANYFGMFISDGVFPNPANGLKVISEFGNMYVTVGAGSAFIKGRGYILFEKLPIKLEIADIANRRIDAIFLQLNNTKRVVELVYKKGVASANPICPPIIRNADIWELKLAEITVTAGITKITTANIKDTRLDKNVCGIVSSIVESVDTRELFHQYDDYLHRKQAEWNQFQTKEQLDWEKQTDTQQKDFQTQLSTQETLWGLQTQRQEQDYSIFRADIEGWKNKTVVDLAKVVTFDMDNVSSFPGVITSVVGNVDVGIVVTARYKHNNKPLATQNISYLKVNGIITKIEAIEKVYNNDESLFRNVKVVTSFYEGKTETEVFNL